MILSSLNNWPASLSPVVPPYGVGEILTAEIVILRSEATKNPVPGKRATDKERDPFDFAQGRPFDFAQGRPFDFAQGRLFDFAQGRLFDFAQGDNWKCYPLINTVEGDYLKSSSEEKGKLL